MKKFTKFAAVTVIAFSALTLTGCATYATADKPQVVKEEGASDYKIEYVEVEGQTIECLWYHKGQQSGSMDCNWDNPVQK